MNDTRGDYMNNRRKKRNKRIMIGVFVVVILVSVIGFFVGRKQSRLEKTLSNSISMIEYYIIKKPISFVNDIFNEYNDLKDVYDENRILKEKLDSYVNIESENEVLQSEIKKLKKWIIFQMIIKRRQLVYKYVIKQIGMMKLQLMLEV